MLKLNKYLEHDENMIWDIPSFLTLDDSVTKYDYITVYDDNHGTGDLSNATEFSFTTDNEDIFIVPANSFLLLKVQLRRADNGQPYVGADATVTIDCNAFNLFSQARLYIGDEEIERIDHVGISTLLYNLTKYNFSEVNSVRESQLVHTQKTFIRDYVAQCNRNVELLLPIRKMFNFFHQNRFSFRGVKHRIVLNLNDQNKIVTKWGDVPPANGKATISSMIWKIPHVEPSLQMRAKLETMLAKNSSLNLKWIATNTFKFSPPRNTEIRIPIASSIHRPTHVFIAFQNANRETDQEQSYMHFDHLNLTEVSVNIDSISFPDRAVKCDFANKHVNEAYLRFLDACEHGVTWEESYRNFINQYPIFHIDVSRHPEELYENSRFPNIVINAKFNAAPAADYNMFVIVYNIREVNLNLENKKMRITK